MVESKEAVINIDWTKELGHCYNAKIVNNELRILNTPLFQSCDYQTLIKVKIAIEDVIKIIERERNNIRK